MAVHASRAPALRRGELHEGPVRSLTVTGPRVVDRER